ncbi:MAG: flippase-like domain-containing protein [Deltaproteobacteria bacterium]|nr:flippase-like domain-containing protein [Deltaproteobacteria bacterium]
MSSKAKKRFYQAFGLFLSGIFLWICYRKIQGQDNGQPMLPLPKHTSYLMLAVITHIGVMCVRTLIWQYLLTPIRKLSFRNLFSIMYIGYFANHVLPLKAGEFFRASFPSKKWKLPYTQVLTTVGLERYFEGTSLLIVFFTLTFLLEIPLWMKSFAYALVGILIGILVFLQILWKRQPNLEKWKDSNPWLYRLIKELFHIHESSTRLKSIPSFLILIVLGLIAWNGQSILLKCIEASYGISLSWPQTLFVIVCINFAAAIPSAPGNIGTLQAASIFAYSSSLIGLSQANIAFGIGIFYFLVQALPIFIIGTFNYYRWDLSIEEIEAQELA